jgi:hypothetical protein
MGIEEPPPEPSSDPADFRAGLIPCGKGSCRADREICCGHVPHEQGTCLVFSGDRSDMSAMGRACAKIDNQVYPVVCDDSSDCPAGHTCCSEMGGDPAYEVCLPLDPSGWHRCNGFELCRPGSPCRTAGTSCERGICQLPRPPPNAIQVDCFGQTCTGATPICCAPPSNQACQAGPKCVSDRLDCYYQSPVIECSGADDCAPHEHCLFYPPIEHPGWSTYCSQWFGGGIQPVVCRTAQDCPNLYGQEPKCEPNEDFAGIKTCR